MVCGCFHILIGTYWDSNALIMFFDIAWFGFLVVQRTAQGSGLKNSRSLLCNFLDPLATSGAVIFSREFAPE